MCRFHGFLLIYGSFNDGINSSTIQCKIPGLLLNNPTQRVLNQAVTAWYVEQCPLLPGELHANSKILVQMAVLKNFKIKSMGATYSATKKS
jgi:hypothetical protein